jgi:two-component system, NarL family, nitrate/nitrite response regulator NarL
MVDAQHATETDVQSLLIEFLEQFKETEIANQDMRETQEIVMLEFVHDGVRYCLVRSVDSPPLHQANLSPREKEIVRLVAKGMANKAIAVLLDVSPWTVATHLRRIFMKLGVSTRAEMIARVLESGLMNGNTPSGKHPGGH